MPRKKADQLSRRERQIMDIVYRCERVTAAEVREQLPDPPSYSAVRALLRILEDKGHLRHAQDGNRYVYEPTVSRTRASRTAMENVLSTFFEGSAEQAMAALLDMSESELSGDELDRLAARIERARQEGR
ncbi:MAG: BlaI/MecI/CopY family transcriptional regulator [Acidobacteriota bacterium]